VDALVVSRRKGESTCLRARQGASPECRGATASNANGHDFVVFCCATLEAARTFAGRFRGRLHACGSRWASGVAHEAITDAEVTGGSTSWVLELRSKRS
jgi:hypothetical protein